MDIKSESDKLKEIYDRGIINVGNLSRMERVMKRALSGEPITVGFIGGSITAGAAATTFKTCYAYLVYSWWKDKFPMSKVEYLNAGVGATTSKFGVARVYENVLSHNPQVVFAEFSVNDTDNELFQETFEGLVRRILLYEAAPALFMFHNVFYDDGHNAQRVHSAIGKYYDLPIVSMKESLYTEILKGTLKNTEISADNLHPNDLGHELVAGVIINLLEHIYNTVTEPHFYENDYMIPSGTVTNNRYFGSKCYSNTNTEPIAKGFVPDETPKDGVWDVFRYGWSAKEKGSSILFEVEGSMISIQYRKYAIHPAPIAEVIIDGDKKKAYIIDANFNETWGDCLYLQDILVDGTPGKHSIEIVITEAVEGKEFYLASVITA